MAGRQLLDRVEGRAEPGRVGGGAEVEQTRPVPGDERIERPEVDAHRPPWSVSALAQAGAVAATTAEAQRFIEDSRERLLRDCAYLVEALRGFDLRVHPSETIYILVDLGPGRRATALRGALLARHHVLVRDATSFGLPHHVRLGVRPRAESDRLVAALRVELGR